MLVQARPLIYRTPADLARITNSPVQVCRLLFAVADNDHDNLRMLRGAACDRVTVEQRLAVYWAGRRIAGASYPEIGRAMNRDHSCVIRGFRAAERLRDMDPSFREMTVQLVRAVQRRSKAAERG